MAKEICDFELCTGCQACVSVCPTGCVTAAADNEGFFRPVVDSDQCIDCNLCRKTCPINNRVLSKSLPTKSYLFQTMSPSNKLESASGGAFQDICRAFLGGYSDVAIFGVGLDSENRARFARVDSVTEVHTFSGSKYVQAEIGDIYKDVENCLRSRKHVVFAGTPCQVDGLRHYLRRPYDKLLCIDLVCHGVGSPKVFERYVGYLERKYGSKVEQFQFTVKKGGWLHRRVLARFANGKQYSRMAITLDDPYMTAFFSHAIMRPSCYSCRYTNLSRVGDLTIGDAWGVEKRKPKQYYREGVSLIIASTAKGEEALRACGNLGRLEEVELADYIGSNPQLQKPIKPHPSRAQLMALATADDVPFDDFVDKLCYRSKLRRWVSEAKARFS